MNGKIGEEILHEDVLFAVLCQKAVLGQSFDCVNRHFGTPAVMCFMMFYRSRSWHC